MKLIRNFYLALAILILTAASVAAQTCPSNVTSIGGETSCWVPPSSGTTINDLVDSNPLTIANDSTYALQPNNTLGCGMGSSVTPSGISSGCDIQSNATYQPTSMTLVMKFAGTGGPLAQFGSVSSVNALYQYFELYLDSFGRLTFGAYNYGALNVIQTGKPDRPLVFADGNPHIVVASIGSNGMRLYVDGNLLASNSQTLANYTSGYWLFGTAALTGAGPSGNSWPYGPAQNWFNGTIYYMAWWNSQLTDAQAETLSNPGSNPPSPISNSYVNVTGQLASLAISQGLAYANLPVTFQVGAGQLPACGLTTPVAASTQTYQTDAAGNLPSNVQLPQGVHVNMLWAGTTTPLIMPCQTSINISELIPAQTPLPDAVSAINLAGPQFQGVTVANPATGTIAPATLTSPGTVPNTCAGGTTTINRNLGAQQTCTMSASTSITFSNLEDGAPPLIVDVIENATGGYTPTFVAPSGYTLIWPGNTNVQPSQPSTAAGVHTFYGFVIEGTNIYGSITSSTSSSGTFPLTATANFNNYSGININTLNLTLLTAPTPTITSTCSGTCATTYTYEITCLGDNSTHTAPSASETCTNAASLSGSNFCTLNWTAGTGCSSGYNVYGRVSGSLGLLATVSGTTYTDTGTDSPGAAPPSTNTTGSVNTGGNENITGNASVGGTLGVTGNATIGGTLSVTGATTLTGGVSGNVNATGTFSSGTNGGTGGQLTLNGSTSGSAVIKAAAAAGTPAALTLPTTNGSSGNLLSTDGSGNLSWAASFHMQVYTSGSGNFTVPSGVTVVCSDLYGAGGGGGGGGGNNLGAGGGGGGGGAHTRACFMGLTPGGTLAYSVGTAGTVGTGASNTNTGGSNGGNGGNTTFNSVTANGGSGGTLGNTSGGTSGFGGAAGTAQSYPLAAGTIENEAGAAGSNSSGNVAGAAAVNFGEGGIGGTGGAAGVAGTNGAAGSAGEIIVTW